MCSEVQFNRYCSKIPSSPIIDICFQYLSVKKKLIIIIFKFVN